MKKRSSVKKYASTADVVLVSFFRVFLWFWFVVILYPLLFVVAASFSSARAISSGEVWFFPVDFTLIAYRSVFKNHQIVSGFGNSFYYTFFGVLFSLFLTVFAAFPLSRKEFIGRKAFAGIFLFTMIFSGGLIPTYLLMRNLNLINTRPVVILASALSVWNVMIVRTYFQHSLPDELYEAAQIDGCSDLGFLVRFAIPLSAPVLAVVGLFYAVNFWNSYFTAFIYLKSPSLFPLQIILRNILIMSNIDPTMIKDVEVLMRRQGLEDIVKYAVIVTASVPVLLLYPFVQKYFVRGVMIGALKG